MLLTTISVFIMRQSVLKLIKARNHLLTALHTTMCDDQWVSETCCSSIVFSLGYIFFEFVTIHCERMIRSQNCACMKEWQNISRFSYGLACVYTPFIKVFAFPKGYQIETIGGRRFQESWTKARQWLRYSVTVYYHLYWQASAIGKKQLEKSKLPWLISICSHAPHQYTEMKACCFLKPHKPVTDIGTKLSKQTAKELVHGKKDCCL